MVMIQIEFTQEQIDELDYERYHYPHPKVQRKMEAVYLKSQGLSSAEICRLCRICKTTLVTYLRQYQEGGIERLKELGYGGKTSALDEHRDTLKAYFEEHPPRSAKEAQDEIERLTGIQRSPTQIREFLHRIGMTPRKVGYVPGKSSAPEKQAEQEAFREQELEPRLEEARNGKRAVLFMDAAHFVHSVFLGWVWCFTRLFVASSSGRKRFNVLGAVDAVTKRIFTFTNETHINAASVCALLDAIAAYYGAMPITLVLDNVRYQKCQLVRDYAAALGIELLFLPSYSPHLNLIERLWRFVRKKCLYSKYYADFSAFKQAIVNCLQNANSEHPEELESLLTLNFQSFANVQISTV
jgi:transposase